MAFRAHSVDMDDMNRLRRRPIRPVSTYRRSPALTIRWATPADALRLEILAELDESPVPAPPTLLAIVADELWVAVSAATGAVIADPFRPTTEVAALALARSRQLRVPDHNRWRSAPARWRGAIRAVGFEARTDRA